ncbi:hypothetical protein D0Z03_000366 [Geotrichum reessii]|nr:hypothetical protein D0Z03_000366 [Galactomyces reessii]
MATISFAVFMASTQSFILTDLLGMNTGIGHALGNLAFADELLTIALSPLWGVLSDKVGTRPVASFGVMIIGVSFFVYMTPKNYTGLLFVRLFFAVGASAAGSMITAILSEVSEYKIVSFKNLWTALQRWILSSYVVTKLRGGYYEDLDFGEHPYHTAESTDNGESISSPKSSFENEENNGSSRQHISDDGFLEVSEPGERNGKASALVGVASGLGACLAIFLLLPLPTLLKNKSPAKALQAAYFIVGSFALASSAGLFLGLYNNHNKGLLKWFKSVRKNKSVHVAADTGDSNNDQSYIELLKEGFTIAAKEKPIALAYAGSFVARACTVATVMFIPLSVNSFFHKQGRCSGDLHAPLNLSCHQAYILSAMITGVSQTCSLIFAPLWGLTADQYGRKVTLLISSVIGFTGFLGYSIVCNSPMSKSVPVYIFGALMGVAQIGTIIASISLCTDRKRRSSGAIAGVYTFSGGVGILILSKLGGWLSDFWMGAPFLILALMYFGLVCFTLYQMDENVYVRRVFGLKRSVRLSDETEDSFISYD